MELTPAHHGLDEALVAGHVDDGGLVAEKGETQLDGYTAGLLLGSPVRIDPGERLDQQGLAVVDVSRGTDNGVGHNCLREFNFPGERPAGKDIPGVPFAQ